MKAHVTHFQSRQLCCNKERAIYFRLITAHWDKGQLLFRYTTTELWWHHNCFKSNICLSSFSSAQFLQITQLKPFTHIKTCLKTVIFVNNGLWTNHNNPSVYRPWHARYRSVTLNCQFSVSHNHILTFCLIGKCEWLSLQLSFLGLRLSV